MQPEAIYHQPMSNYCYAYDEKTIHIRIRTAKKDFAVVTVLYKDKFDWNIHGTVNMKLDMSDSLFDYYIAEIPMVKRLTYYFRLENGRTAVYFTQSGILKEADDNQSYIFCFQYPYIYLKDIHGIPEWVRDTVFYEIFPDRFCIAGRNEAAGKSEKWGTEPGNDSFYGGNLEGIISKIDYLKNLGITGIYITPIFNSSTNHKYDTIDYYNIDPDFGDMDTLKRLVKQCHNNGIRVILDGVFNHCSYKMRHFQDVLEKGEESEYYSWFIYSKGSRFLKESYESYSIFHDMPKLDTSNIEVQEYFLSIANYWIIKANIDGWRLDVGDELNTEFIKRFRCRLKSINSEVYIVGETWYNGYPWLMGNHFDAVMNYQLTGVIDDYFAKGTMDSDQFKNKVSSIRAQYTKQVNQMNFNIIDSHDTERFLTKCNGNIKKLILALTFLLTYDGVPCIFYGTEIGMSGGNDPGCRKCFEWNTEKWNMKIYTCLKQLIQLRNKYKSLRKGGFSWIEGKKMIVYERNYEEESIIVVINNSTDSGKVKYKKNVAEVIDLMTNEKITSDITVTQMSYKILLSRRNEK